MAAKTLRGKACQTTATTNWDYYTSSTYAIRASCWLSPIVGLLLSMAHWSKIKCTHRCLGRTGVLSRRFLNVSKKRFPIVIVSLYFAVLLDECWRSDTRRHGNVDRFARLASTMPIRLFVYSASNTRRRIVSVRRDLPLKFLSHVYHNNHIVSYFVVRVCLPSTMSS